MRTGLPTPSPVPVARSPVAWRRSGGGRRNGLRALFFAVFAAAAPLISLRPAWLRPDRADEATNNNEAVKTRRRAHATRRSGIALIGAGLGVALAAAPARAANCNAGDTTSLANCITSGTTTSITLTGNITLSAILPAVTTGITINGAGFTLSGNNQFRGFFVQSGTVEIENLAIVAAVAQGGAGGAAGAGGGGGLGAGGAIYAASGSAVTINNVNFTGNQAVGGGGGAANNPSNIGGGGGGGLTGNGGSSIGNAGVGGVGGGGGGLTGNGGNSNNFNAGNGGAPNGGAGGFPGGGDATGVGGGGGGGADGNGGAGASYGGGGGGGNGNGGAGGYGAGGGGGGGILAGGGLGGLGGGGGGGGGGIRVGPGGTGGIGGGAGATGTFGGGGNGGGGAGFGGAVFAETGATLTISGTGTFGGAGGANGVTAGTGANAGAAAGSDLFLQSGTVTLNASGGPLTFNGTIADSSVGSVPSGQGFTAGTTNGSGNSALAIAGGTIVLNGTNTYSGGTTLTAGTLTIGNNSALGSGTLAMAAGTTLGFATTGNFTIANNITVTGDPTFTTPTATTQTISGVISDLGPGPQIGEVTVNGGGTLLLSGPNTYSGGTTICGTACGGGGGNSVLQVNNSIPGTSSSIGTGTLTFDAGTLQAVANNLSFSNAAAINSTGGTIDTNGNNLTWSGVIANGTGTGGLTVASTVAGGVLTLTNTNTYSGGTTINGGTLALTGSGSIADSSGVNVANAAGTFDISGTTTGATITTLSGVANSAVNLGGKTLTLSNASTTFNGVIAGANGALTLTTGTETLTGTNTYTGATTINGGSLVVNGSIATSSLTSVNNTGTLTGVGTVGGTQVNAGGTFAPGSGVPGTSTTVSGNLAFVSGAIYMVQFNAATSTFANVTGTASLAGSVSANFAAGSSVAKQYTILTSSGLGGTTFGSPSTTNLPANFAASLSYNADDVFLNLAATLGAGSGLNGNQQNVANALNNAFNSGGTLPPNVVTIYNFSGTALAHSLSQSSGEVSTDAGKGAFQLTRQFIDTMADRLVGGRSAGGGGNALPFAAEDRASLPPDIAAAYAAVLKAPPLKQNFDQRWSAWGSGFGGAAKTDGNPVVGSNNVTASDYGFAAGMDYYVTPQTLYGFALAGGSTNWSLAQNLGTGRSDAFQAGVYAITHGGPAYLSGALAFANHWFTTNRIAPLGDQLTAKFEGQSYAARVEAGYRVAVLPLAGVTPYAALEVQDFHTPSYSETDLTGGGFALSYNAMTATDSRSELGARFDDLTMLGTMPLVLRGRLAWAHDWVSNPALSAVFQALPGSNFTVNGAAPPANSALTTAAAELHLNANWTALAKFDGEFASNSQTYAGTGTLRYTW
jgi:uncharacterized protein with beta-barrel porin domain